MRVLTAAAAIAVAGLALALALAWRTWVGLTPAAGVVATLADAAMHHEAPGVARPGAVLATVYLPPFPLAVAAARAGGLPWRDALRTCAALSALALLLAVAFATRAAGGGGVGVAAACALAAAVYPVQAAALEGRADLLAAALSTLALGAWLRDRDARGWALPAACALAWACKATACAVPLAVVIACARAGAWRRAGAFAARGALAGAALLLLLQPWHGATWSLDVLRTLLMPRHALSPLRGPAELLRYLASFTAITAAAVLAGISFATRPRAPAPTRTALVLATVIALVALTDRQSDHNHLIEPLAFACVAAGAAVQALRSAQTRAAYVLAVTLVAVASVSATWRNLDSTRRAAARPEAKRAAIANAIQSAPGEVLTEDPLLALAAGRRPPVADVAVLRSLALRNDPRAQRLQADLARDRWAMIVLDQDAAAGRDGWYRDFHFGRTFVDTLLARDVRAGEADGYVIYRPRAAR